MAPTFHVKVHKEKHTHTHTTQQQPKPWIPSGRCEMLVPANALRPAAVDVYSASEVAAALHRALIYCCAG